MSTSFKFDEVKVYKRKKIAVLVSGNGSNLQSIIDACNSDQIFANICIVVSNVKNAYAIDRAQKNNIASIFIDHKCFKSREEFDQKILDILRETNPDLVVLAGFMRILSPIFIKELQGKLINIHPSLLPKYKGLNTHERAINNREEESGLTIHFVTEELDGGPIIYQKKVKIEKDDTSESLKNKVMVKEHQAYPQIINLFIKNRLKLINGQVYLDEKKAPKFGIDL